MKKILIPLLLPCVLLIAGCSSSSGWGFFPGVHKVAIQQGTKITQDMVDQLKPGMTKAQVNFVLGTPLLADTFNQDRWDFLYTFTRGDGSVEEEQLTVYFVDGVLDYFEGDFTPTVEESEEVE